MSQTIPIDKAGRIVIPKGIRERIGVDASTRFEVGVVLGRIELVPVRNAEASKLVRKNGRLVVASTGQKFSAAELVDLDREDRLADLSPRVER